MPVELTHSIVLVGHMNPSIHHPSWYEAIEAIKSADVEVATNQFPVVTTPQMSSFSTAGFNLKCLLDRWEISVSDPSRESQALDVASKAFSVLGETPITRFGINYQGSRELEHSTPESLAAALSSTPFMIQIDGSAPSLESMNLEFPLPQVEASDGWFANRRLRFQLSLRREKTRSIAQAGVNVHHEVVPREGKRLWSLPAMLEAAVQVREVCQKHIEEALARLDRPEE